MKASEAVQFVNELIFRPGVRLRATDMSWYMHDQSERIAIEFYMDTKDSSIMTSSGQYIRDITIAPGESVDVSDMTEEDLLYKILKLDAKFQEHESREFLRVRRNGQWVAPFHPHNWDSSSLWDNYEREARKEAVSA